MKVCVEHMALSDISTYLKGVYQKDYYGNHYIVKPNNLEKKEIRRLNYLLGIRDVNFINNKNGSKK